LGFTGEPNALEITEKQGVAWFNTFDIYVDTGVNVLNAGLIERTLNPQTKNLSESIAAGAALVGQGADVAAGLLANIGEEKLEVLGAVFGGSSKYGTGSSVEINALGLIAGAAKKFKPLTAGIFVEYADGSYDTENDFDGYDSVKGDGKASYMGGGVLVKKDIKGNFYIEGQARAGQISNDYKTGLSDGQGNTADFDYSSIYFGLNIGAGYKYKISESLSVKGYGKYIFTNVGGGEADLASGEKYEFDAVMSNRIKAGIKGGYEISEKVKPYIGIAYDYEISGEINAKIGGVKIAAPTLNGGTIQGEAGVSVKAAENLNIDISAQIYTGAREGFAGLLKLKYEI
jgi:outer membrane autotransporter protein